MPSFDCAHLTSFDIESLFTNIPLDETINICVDKPFENKTKIINVTKESFRSLLELATLDSFFSFNGKYYKQRDGCLMNVFLIVLLIINLFHIEEVYLQCMFVIFV